MAWYIRYGSINNADCMDWEKIEAKNEDEAVDWAYEMACDDYESYAGLHGTNSFEDYLEEGMSEVEAEEASLQDRESWLSYEAKWLDVNPNEE